LHDLFNFIISNVHDFKQTESIAFGNIKQTIVCEEITKYLFSLNIQILISKIHLRSCVIQTKDGNFNITIE
jgi:hypothetical protein